MSTRPDLPELNAFVDGELGLTRQLEIESLVSVDPSLRAQVESLRSLRDAVRGGAQYHAAPAMLLARARALAAAPSSSAAAVPRRRISSAGAFLQRWFAWRPLATSLAAVAALAVAVNLVLLPAQQQERLEQEVVATHVRATLSQHLVDVQSSDHHTVKPWLSARLDYSPPVFDLTPPGSAFLGGRVDYLDGRPVAAMVYRRGEHLVDSFVWPTTVSDRQVAMSAQRGFNLAHWVRRGMAHWVVSDLNRQELANLVREIDASENKPGSDSN